MTLDTISLKTKETTLSPQSKAEFEQLVKGKISCLSRIKGGGNNQVYYMECPDYGKCIGKVYFQSQHDGRERGKIEFESLKYLWEKGLSSVVKPIAADDQFRYCVYEYIEGDKIECSDIQKHDIQMAVQFLSDLRALGHKTDFSKFSKASEACFSIKDVERNIQSRIERLEKVNESSGDYSNLKGFLHNELIPFLGEALTWSMGQLSHIGIDDSRDLGKAEITLSPSDFGFHNALRRRDGTIIFLDFEYFGWDDPAKMICDFMLHPAMDINISLKKQFVDGILEQFEEYDQLKLRSKALYPLYGIKWCLIFLNEFIRSDFQRRQFASAPAIKRAKVQREQLKKSERMLSEVKKIYFNNTLIQ